MAMQIWGFSGGGGLVVGTTSSGGGTVVGTLVMSIGYRVRFN